MRSGSGALSTRGTNLGFREQAHSFRDLGSVAEGKPPDPPPLENLYVFTFVLTC